MERLRQLLETIKHLLFSTPHRMTPAQFLYAYAVTSLGSDASPADIAPDELGCADSLTSIIAKVYPDLKWTNRLSTAAVYKDMVASPNRFQPVQNPQAGDIIISPTKFLVTGHCGIVGNNGIIMSNNSFKDDTGVRGIWDENYSLDSWHRRFRIRQGLSTYYFRLL